MNVDEALSVIRTVRESMDSYSAEGFVPETDARGALDKLESYIKRVNDTAYTDHVTGIANRHGFMERAENELNHREYTGDMSLLIADLDYFKMANDECGHPVGDDVLRMVGETLRDTDICGRYGGDEFLALLPGTCREGAEAAASRLATDFMDRKARYMAERSDRMTQAQVDALEKVGISIGIATTGEYMPLHELIEQADADLMAKKSGVHAENGASR